MDLLLDKSLDEIKLALSELRKTMTDGRNTPPSSGSGYMRQLLAIIKQTGCGQVATVSGRYWAMGRDTRWDRVEKVWRAMVGGQGLTAANPIAAAGGEFDFHLLLIFLWQLSKVNSLNSSAIEQKERGCDDHQLYA